MKGIITFLIVSLPAWAMAQTSTLEIDGTSYRYVAKGTADRKAGQPLIILENGLGTGLEHWDIVMEGLAGLAPVFAYDRAGTGHSETRFSEPTFQFVASTLKSMLNKLDLPPPYVLIGHSLGGVYVRGFAGLYPDEVRALVFIDPADFTETKVEWNLIFKEIGVPDKRIEELLYDRLYKPTTPDSARYGVWSENEVLRALRRTDFAELNSLPLPDVPIYFFIGGKFEVPQNFWSKDFDQKQFFSVRTDKNIKRWRNFIYTSSKGGSLVYLSNSGHFLHRDDAGPFLGSMGILFRQLGESRIEQ